MLFEFDKVREEAAASMEEGPIFVKVDCELDAEFCRTAGVKGYPTLQLYVDGDIIPYHGRREKDALIEFVRDPRSPQTIVPPTSPRSTPFVRPEVAIELDAHNFDTLTRSGVWFVLFHIGSKFDREVIPVFEEACRILKASGVRTAVVDAIHSDKIAKRFDLKGFPAFMTYVNIMSLLLISSISQGVVRMFLEKDRTASNFVAFVQKAAKELHPPRKLRSPPVVSSPAPAVIQQPIQESNSDTSESLTIGQCVDAHLLLAAAAFIAPILTFCMGVLLGWKIRGFDNRKRQ